MLHDAIAHTITALLALTHELLSHYAYVTNVAGDNAAIQVGLVPGSEGFFAAAASLIMAAVKAIEFLAPVASVQ